ncbi:MarR family winged helix-turn-helix transcriptional regulator [Macrococcus armenti]|uniref:MarR family winged helix-turn-helix transcriptional regulator n=1 Tax=Macrococcus armenti TaxID=2875764 RepID=UPI001CCF9A93|nr:MarR family transcriptional regulator [Macrococcus armenti]UBH12461.1 MarR family transcriptional regulator [Macrococcus armenti]UBH21616.1 MarR family transcriptional regulator [Macrococcus armenti]
MDQQIIALEYELRRLADIIKNEGRQELIAYNITDIQFMAVQWIKETDAMTIGALSKHLNLAISSTSELVDQLVQKDFAVRKKDDEDKRKVNIHLTKKGQKLIDDVIIKRQKYLQSLVNCSEFDAPDYYAHTHALYRKTEEGEQIESTDRGH